MAERMVAAPAIDISASLLAMSAHFF